MTGSNGRFSAVDGKNSRRNQPPGLRVSDHTLVEESGAYDIIGEAIEQREIKGEPYTVYDFRFVGIGALDIGTFVDERNPKRIALNYLENLGPHVGGRSYDGISYTDYRLLVKAIGEKYAKRLVSSEYLIADYLSRPVESELVMYKKIRQWIEESMERDFAKIVPGVTKVGDLEGEVTLMRPGRSRIPDDYVFQGGDLFRIDHGAEGYYDLREEGSGYWGLWQVYNIPWKFGNFFELKAEYGYVLREGETDLPPELKRLWSDAMKIRQITADNIKIGRTGRETFEIITQKLTEDGFNVNAVQKFHKDTGSRKDPGFYRLTCPRKRRFVLFTNAILCSSFFLR